MATIVKQQRTVTPFPPAAPDVRLPAPRPGTGSVQIIKTGHSTSPSPPEDSLPIPSGGVAARLSGTIIGKDKAGSEGLVEFNLADIVEQGRQQIMKCRAEVEAMMGQAQAESVRIKQQAKSTGHAEGQKAAAAEIDKRIAVEAEAKAQAQVESLRKMVVQMRTQYDQWMHQYAEVMTATAIAAAERLLRKKVELPNASPLAVAPDPDDSADSPSSSLPTEEHVLVRWAREALHSTRSAGRLTLAVHPDTLAELGRQFDELLSSPDLPEQSVVIPDETLSVGDVVVRQDGGEIRAGLEAQLQRLREELL
ncbi:FliH/SctL family protein [Neorhodopirellula pilleata]|uniref:Flagellar assembly protein FliH n=1 Tax=Neorhodopirellula pilleata TaxID=2714738 RepID=A0A5C6AQU1_9BACT|nr:FliH/SctL family protein [Neorhodopirellula pilleata]TWU02090.1 flagellar assembly protein H [Neorhodopirellula pilleata]